MTIEQATPVALPAARERVRETGIDFVRALCIIGVVLMHAIMVGVTVGNTGPVFSNASHGTWWVAPLSWVLMVVPLFFVIGGFSGILFYRRLRATGGTAAGFIAARIHRLLLPALLVFAVVGSGLALLTLLGVPANLVGVAGLYYSQPLWFLGVFLLCQALLPALTTAHERAPLRSLAALTTLAAGVDIARAISGIDSLGFFNLAFVWLALQQLGFFFADGTIDRLSRRARALIGFGAVAALALACGSGLYSPDLIANVNPPTTALLLVGIAHTSGLSLFRAGLETISRRPGAVAITSFVTPRAMTIYLWHMPVLLAMAGISAISAMVFGIDLPALSTAAWWLGRPVWLIVAFVLIAIVATSVSGLETVRLRTPTPSRAKAAAAVLLGGASVVIMLISGATVITAFAAVALVLLALQLSNA
ncbi:acyltransferase [Cryobacterium sp. SO1]|uniref:acyltransferase family protein n=1 Tax=Cryobacterium sp. SO1 TaxID=1897061 RepID=UPI0010F28811|nr:acyltransferase [Cryobacterium sp. SO1]RZI34274.1 hypothetical protein BJQ95_03415 [Cryobacterium sp. SO1]